MFYCSAFSGRVAVDLIHFVSGTATRIGDAAAVLPEGAGSVGFFCVSGSAAPVRGLPDCPTFDSLFTAGGCAGGAADCMQPPALHNPGTIPAQSRHNPGTMISGRLAISLPKFDRSLRFVLVEKTKSQNPLRQITAGACIPEDVRWVFCPPLPHRQTHIHKNQVRPLRTGHGTSKPLLSKHRNSMSRFISLSSTRSFLVIEKS